MVDKYKERLLAQEQPTQALTKDAVTVVGPFELMVVGATLCTVINTMVGYLRVPLPALIQGRYVLQWSLVLCALLLRSRRGATPFRPFGPPGQRRWLVLRGVVYYGFIWLWWTTLTLVPVGDAVAVVKCEVFVAGVLSALFCGERLTLRWWLCCFGALLGVVLVAHPPVIFGGEDSASPLGRLLNVLTPIVAGSLPILIKFAPDAHFLEVQHSCDFISGLVLSPMVMLATGGSTSLLAPRTMETILAISTLGLVALSSFTLAYQRGQAGRVSLVGYVEVPIAYISQVAIFGAPLHPLAAAGAVLVVVSAIGASTELRRKTESIETPVTRMERLPSI